MVLHKLHLDDFDEVEYDLIAIHTSLEDFRLAYFINQALPVLLQKNKEEIQITIKEGETRFSRFSFEVAENEVSWNLIQNKNEVTFQKKQGTQSLFADTDLEIATKVYLLPEFKKVDYFLKIENAEESVTDIAQKISTIDRISTVYKVDAGQIKSKNNLIF